MKKLKYIVAVAFLVILSACGDDKSSPSIIQYAGDASGLFTEGRISDVNLFYDAMVKTGLDSRLSAAQERTYLALNNAAMQSALQSGGFLTVSAADVDFLTTLIDNHTFSGILLEDDLVKQNLTSESGELVYVSAGGTFNAQGTIVDGNNTAANGVVHVIGFPVLNFPSDDIAGIVDALANDATTPEFTILNAALAATGLDAALGGTTEYTVLAPTDAAFAAAGFADFATLDAATTDEELTEILQNHVIAGRFLTIDLASGRTYTLNGGSGDAKGLDLTVEAGTVSSEISDGATSDSESVNTLATNGIIHIVDNVIFPEAYLYEALGGVVGVDDDNGISGFFATFFAALDASGFNYENLLSSEDEYSVIVPSAYAGGSTRAELDGYIFEGAVNFSDAIGTRVESIGEDQYFVGGADAIDSDAVAFYGEFGSVIVAGLCGDDACMQDESAYNGNITFLGGTGITPLPDMSVASVVDADVDGDSLKLYTGALRFLELDSLIDVTYLALEDSLLEQAYRDALDAGGVVDPSTIADEDYDELLANIDAADAATLAAVIDRHIITELFFGLDLVAGNSYSNRAGGTIEIVSVTVTGIDEVTMLPTEETEFGILVNDDGDISTIFFNFGDVTGSNGVLHTLSEVIPEP